MALSVTLRPSAKRLMTCDASLTRNVKVAPAVCYKSTRGESILHIIIFCLFEPLIRKHCSYHFWAKLHVTGFLFCYICQNSSQNSLIKWCAQEREWGWGGGGDKLKQMEITKTNTFHSHLYPTDTHTQKHGPYQEVKSTRWNKMFA